MKRTVMSLLIFKSELIYVNYFKKESDKVK
jgi:hypothetical protein